MRRMSFVLLALILSLYPAVWARRMAAYPGWAGETALRSVGCRSVSTRFNGWAVLPDTADVDVAKTAVSRILTDLGFAAQSTATAEYLIASGIRPGATISAQASPRDGRWLVYVDLTCADNARNWYLRINDTLSAVGYAGRTSVAVLGQKPRRPGCPSDLLLAKTICNGIDATVGNTVADGVGARIISGDAGLIAPQYGTHAKGGTFALSLSFSANEQATAITLSVPGLR